MKTKFPELKKVFKKLHGPKGCPWDKKQTHKSLIRHLREEVEEFVVSVKKDDYRNMREELGDILLHVMFNAKIAERRGKFDIEDVIEELIRKLKRRHPHVFGSAKAGSSHQVIANWQRIKLEEKKGR
jgi:tetrapyrrole methylase family protein / MazG family protein